MKEKKRKTQKGRKNGKEEGRKEGRKEKQRKIKETERNRANKE